FMPIEKTIRMLHPLERRVLPFLSDSKQLSEITQKTGLKDVEVMRALEWLENKELISTKKIEKRNILLGKNGKLYSEKGLPEYRVLEEVRDHPVALTELSKRAHLSMEEVNAALGILRHSKLISLRKEQEVLVEATTLGKKALKERESRKTPEEIFLAQSFPLEKVRAEDEEVFKQLSSRRDIVVIKDTKDREVTLTAQGRAVLKKGLGKEFLGSVTRTMLLNAGWKNKQFRAYDTAINVPPIYPGKKHIVTQAVEYIKMIWLELGFKEMNGRMIDTAFWDLDALFVPQDHPARDMQDTFYIAEPCTAALPPEAKKIRTVHETGGKTGSRGWGSSWSAEEAKKLLLRTHMTVLSAHTLARLKKSELPAKFFAVGKVFRNEALDWKHLFEFYQVDGIVVDPSANMKHLKGYLKEFYRKMGYEKVRIRPAHFPYTEPSCEVEVFHPVKEQWVELGGAGIFRPELVIPLLGEDIPVLAWGLGLDRIITSYYNLTDIRDLYNNDIKMLREAKQWVR
ncbi:phenylalanine--tRNA ligase subunit alpha, partial [Candidatus Woesearchaeota archaeon]|nr:phenylalanine--tRNA ligase subunit alpha [Candidatus Woesearchaeota archaeon]